MTHDSHEYDFILSRQLIPSLIKKYTKTNPWTVVPKDNKITNYVNRNQKSPAKAADMYRIGLCS